MLSRFAEKTFLYKISVTGRGTLKFTCFRVFPRTGRIKDKGYKLFSLQEMFVADSFQIKMFRGMYLNCIYEALPARVGRKTNFFSVTYCI